MSVRVKVTVIIICITAAISVIGTGFSIYAGRRHFVQTIADDMTVISKIAVKMVASELHMLKAEAVDAAEVCLRAARQDTLQARRGDAGMLRSALEEQARERGYLSLAVMDGKGVLAGYGDAVPDDDFARSAPALQAFAGRQVISSTERAKNGQLVLRVCVPMDSRILVASLPGDYLNHLVAEFRIWQSGNIFIIDAEGTMISNTRAGMVEDRLNLIDVGMADPDPLSHARETGEFFKSVIHGNTAGTGTYYFEGAVRVCAYSPIIGSDGWILGVVALIDESPTASIVHYLLLSAVLFLALGTLAAVAAGGIIAMPFEQITEQNAHLAALREAAETASRAKSDFLSNMSHEMRTPLNAVIGMTAIAEASSDVGRKDYCLRKIGEASTHLLGVINDILDISKIESGKFDLAYAEFNVEKMLQKVVNVVNFRVDEKQLAFTVHIDDRMPCTLIGDDQRLAQVLANLLSNAVKFTPEQGAVRLDVRLQHEENGVCVLRMEVRDTGIGISEEQQARLFNAFQQADSGISRRFGGTGLGLTISKRIVEMMGGTIWVESEPGKGSTFAFTIRAERGAEDGGSLLNPGLVRRDIRILAVDEDRENVNYLESILHCLGVSCASASGVDEALELIERNGPYDLYFVDRRTMSGPDAVRRIQEPGKAPVVMMSAAEWGTAANGAGEAGVAECISKPIFPSSVADSINKCLGSSLPHAEQTPSSGAGDCFEGCRILLAEDVEINREIVLALLEPTGVEIDCAVNGAEAVRRFSETPDRYDLIFMDVQMPEMDGHEASRRIRAMDVPEAAAIPIIAMTANVFREDIDHCLAAGMNGHVGKPLNLEEVMDRLREFLPERKRHKRPPCP
ncbi:MAG: response regulator [Desulfovibrio sp.]|jgi:signal transduction histidine kinase/DNA-binding response OmpR family regulator|nr:response regulator [Desulfovibrio sp.]